MNKLKPDSLNVGVEHSDLSSEAFYIEQLDISGYRDYSFYSELIRKKNLGFGKWKCINKRKWLIQQRSDYD